MAGRRLTANRSLNGNGTRTTWNASEVGKGLHALLVFRVHQAYGPRVTP
jgi:hypothetical protein